MVILWKEAAAQLVGAELQLIGLYLPKLLSEQILEMWHQQV